MPDLQVWKTQCGHLVADDAQQLGRLRRRRNGFAVAPQHQAEGLELHTHSDLHIAVGGTQFHTPCEIYRWSSMYM